MRMPPKKPFLHLVVIVMAIGGIFLLFINPGYYMQTAYLVKIPDSQKPIFPDSCVVCKKPKGEKLEILPVSDEHGRVEFYLYGLGIKPGVGTLLPIPVHDSCARAVRNSFLKWLLLSVAVAAGIAIIGTIRGYSIFYSCLAALVAMTPFLFIFSSKPVPIEFYHVEKSFSLVFQDRAYAEQVARLNHVEAQLCTNPYTGLPPTGEPLKKTGER
jgi:hypothetical protein